MCVLLLNYWMHLIIQKFTIWADTYFKIKMIIPKTNNIYMIYVTVSCKYIIMKCCSSQSSLNGLFEKRYFLEICLLELVFWKWIYEIISFWQNSIPRNKKTNISRILFEGFHNYQYLKFYLSLHKDCISIKCCVLLI